MAASQPGNDASPIAADAATSDPAAAFDLHNDSAAAHTPLVLDSPHSWRDWPADAVVHQAGQAALLSTWDAWVDELWLKALDGSAPLLAARFHRAYIDVNRARDDIDPAQLAAAWPTPLRPTDKSRRGFGLIRQLALPGVPMYAAPLAVADVQGRIRRCYDPYHERLAGLLRDAQSRFGWAVHVDCHSMKSVGNAMNEDAGRPRPDVVLSDLDGRSAHPLLMQWMAGALKAQGLSVQINDPYRGAELLRRHGVPHEGRYSVQIEINRALYMDEARVERHAGFDRLARQLAGFVQQLHARLASAAAAPLRPGR